MDLHIYLSLPAHLCSGYLLESFPTLSEIFVEETLFDLFVIAFCCDDRSSVDTDVNRIHGIFLLAGTPCARFLFFDAHGSGLYFFFYVIYAVYDRRYVTVLLKEWMINNRRVSQMEKAHVVSEVERLKEQISPELLFKTLHQSGELTLSEPETASKMLMKLSQLLRYQLYDCNRAKVLLSSEITFLTNYLTLEQTSRPQFYYEFTSEGEVNRMLVPPLLFIPFVQYIVKAIDEQQIQPPVSLKTHLKAEKGTIIFACACPEVNLLSSDKGLERIRQRLDILYGSRYRLHWLSAVYGWN